MSVDPVLGVSMPAGTSKAAKAAAQQEHFRKAMSSMPSLIAMPPADEAAEDTAAIVASLSPSDLLQRRVAFVEQVKNLRLSLITKNGLLVDSCPAHVRDVLLAASPGGIQVALLTHLLGDISDHDSELAADLLRGFPLTGFLPVDLMAKKKLVRTAKETPSSLL